MTKDQKNEVIELLKGKFSQYDNFYVADTESLSVEQVVKLRRACFDKKVEMKVAKNTLIKKALESLDTEKYTGVYDSLHKVTALMFSENPKDPALIITSFRKDSKGEKPVLKAAFINGDVYTGDNSLKGLTQIKTKNELIGEVIGLLQSPAKRVLAALLHHHEKKAAAAVTEIEVKAEPKPEAKATEAKAEAKLETKPEVKAEVKEEVVPEVMAEAKPTVEAEAKPIVDAEVKPTVEVESKPTAEEVKPEVQAEVKPADDAETKPAE
jgi:large subunit ribosomal protein L10